VNETILKDIMEIYTKTTNISTICMNSANLSIPSFSFGLDFLLLKEYIDFEEIISFLDSEFNQISDDSMESNSFHTFYTKNLFVYSIVFLRNNMKAKMALVLGPILTILPHKDFIEQLFFNKVPLQRSKREFTGLINSLPLLSIEQICQVGKLLLAISSSCAENSYNTIQKVHGTKNTEIIKSKKIKSTINPGLRNNDYCDFYKFCSNLSDKIKHGNTNEIINIVERNRYLFNNIKSIGDNNRSLKNICLIICSIACHFAIQANVPYERMFHYFTKSANEFELLHSENEIIVHMTSTVETFAHAVFVMSNNNFSLHVSRILQYIKSHFSEPLTLKQLANYTQISPVYLSSLIKKETNMSLSEHINLVRIDESKKRLIYSNMSIQDIAFDVGYNHQSHFNFIFKKMEGITPLEYRKKMGSNNFV